VTTGLSSAERGGDGREVASSQLKSGEDADTTWKGIYIKLLRPPKKTPRPSSPGSQPCVEGLGVDPQEKSRLKAQKPIPATTKNREKPRE